MTAIKSISLTGAQAKAQGAAPAHPPRIAPAPEDQARVKRKLEKTAEDAIDIVQAMIDHAKQLASESESVPRLTKDEIAIIEHTASNAIRVFQLGQAPKGAAPLEEPPGGPKGFAGLKVFGARPAGTIPGGKAKPAEGEGPPGGGSSE